jgi:hypothetical protein
MIKEIEKIKMPEWLNKSNFVFNINEILKDSLYYPCSEFDGDPVKYLMGNVFSFVYVDYGVSKEDFYNQINNNGFVGYNIIHKKSISQNELIPNGWKIKIKPNLIEENPNIYYSTWTKKPFCEWIIFERNSDRDESYNPKRFSLLYLCADGAAAYQAIYLSNKIRPKIITIIQPGEDFGGNYTVFRDKNLIFCRSVFHDLSQLPTYLVNGGWGHSDYYEVIVWHEYNIPVKLFKTDRATLKIWKLNISK